MKRFAFVVGAVMLLAGCGSTGGTPKSGDSCNTGDTFCEGADRMLQCIDKTWKVMLCRGPRACQGTGGVANCDQTISVVGDPCLVSSVATACTVDVKSALICTNGLFSIARECESCQAGGPSGEVICAPKTGATCELGSSAACESKTLGLFCLSSKWTRIPCRGAGGCSTDFGAGKVTCDNSLGQLNEPCGESTGNAGACAVDGKSELVCTNGVFTKRNDCVTCDVTATNQISCMKPCGPSNCAGCCFNGACQAGTAASACGKAGGACFACTGNGICKTDQTCGVDPNSRWKIQPVSATLPEKNGAGEAWDVPGGLPDPFVALFCPGTQTVSTTVTPTVADTLTASWSTTSGTGCIMTASALMTAGFKAQVMDEDISSHDVVAVTAVTTLSEADFSLGYVSFSGTTLPALRQNLIKQ